MAPNLLSSSQYAFTLPVVARKTRSSNVAHTLLPVPSVYITATTSTSLSENFCSTVTSTNVSSTSKNVSTGVGYSGTSLGEHAESLSTSIASVQTAVGVTVGAVVGLNVGDSVGLLVGDVVGLAVPSVGLSVGDREKNTVGRVVGLNVGLDVGAFVQRPFHSLSLMQGMTYLLYTILSCSLEDPGRGAPHSATGVKIFLSVQSGGKLGS
mmetsp:Transcript_15479/g.33460  ORF Transcript_15479/g.33460 Transcript_15479/m.33460 type:complete len:209 (+) Transcript_15479:654-1280(+)